jgi:hypothetical protein
MAADTARGIHRPFPSFHTQSRKGHLLLIYLKGDPSSADIYYVRKPPGTGEFSRPIRVNSEPGSAIAIGSVRGPQLAIGRNGRVHVGWMGAHPEGPKKVTPMLYARLNDAKTAFEPQRNVMQFATGLDGGASVAAHELGNVYVVWHANPQGNGEAHRRVWVARSSDDGKTGDPCRSADGRKTDGCLRVLRDTGSHGRKGGTVCALSGGNGRDSMILRVSQDHGRHFEASRVAKWELNACPMSTHFITRTRSGILIAWETAGQVFYAGVTGTDTISQVAAPPGPGVTVSILWSLATRAVRPCSPGRMAPPGNVVEQWLGSSLTKQDALSTREAASPACPFGTWSPHRRREREVHHLLSNRRIINARRAPLYHPARTRRLQPVLSQK